MVIVKLHSNAVLGNDSLCELHVIINRTLLCVDRLEKRLFLIIFIITMEQRYYRCLEKGCLISILCWLSGIVQVSRGLYFTYWDCYYTIAIKRHLRQSLQ